MCETDNAVGAIFCGSSRIVRWGWVFKLTTHFLAPHFEINAPCLILLLFFFKFYLGISCINLISRYFFLVLFSTMDRAL